MIELKDVEFSYENNHKVLQNINLSVNKGERVALIGYNGSGKTTLTKLILGILKRQKGNIKVFGNEPNISKREFKFNLGICFDEPKLVDYLTIYEYLEFISESFKSVKKISKNDIDKYIEYFSIYQYKNKLIRSLSLGTLMKVQLISAFISRPNLIVLDEPTNSLDFETILNLEKLINNREIVDTVLVTSHDFDFLENTCDKFYLLYNGQTHLLTRDSGKSIRQLVIEFVEKNNEKEL